jgi:hypothetical protein
MISNFGKSLWLVTSLCLAIFCSGCIFDNTPNKEKIHKEVQELASLEEKKEYLENVLIEIQSFEERREARRFSVDYDAEALNDEKDMIYLKGFYSISSYFEEYGYPSRAELGQYAAFAPYAVVFFSEDSRFIREEQFKYFYGAYRFNDLAEEVFLNYLLIYYEKLVGKNYRLDRRADVQENIHAIFDELNVDY